MFSAEGLNHASPCVCKTKDDETKTLERSGVVGVPVGRYGAAKHHTHRNPWLAGPRATAQIASKPKGKGTDRVLNLEVEGCGPQQDSHLKNDQDQGCFPKFP
jgi:hypothetical protein